MIVDAYLAIRYRLKTMAWLCGVVAHRQGKNSFSGACVRCGRYVGLKYFFKRDRLRRAER